PATHMPSPPRKLVSVGTVARTEPSPPANHAQPVRAGRRTGESRIPGLVGLFSSCVKAVLIEIEETPDSPASWPRACLAPTPGHQAASVAGAAGERKPSSSEAPTYDSRPLSRR